MNIIQSKDINTADPCLNLEFDDKEIVSEILTQLEYHGGTVGRKIIGKIISKQNYFKPILYGISHKQYVFIAGLLSNCDDPTMNLVGNEMINRIAMTNVVVDSLKKSAEI